MSRRVTFLSLLLLAVAAPAGFVLAGESSQPYIVVFDQDVVSSARQESSSAFVVHASVFGAATPSNQKRDVDETRVRRHVADIEARDRIQAGNIYAASMGGFSVNLTGSQRRTLEREPTVAAIIPDEIISLDDATAGTPEAAGGIRTTGNPSNHIPAGVRRVGAVQSNVSRVDGRDTRIDADVAIIDTGVDRNHPDLNVVGGFNCTGPNRDRWDDVDGHGTHVAGIVGALDNNFGVVGVAPGVRLWSVKVLGPHGSGRMSWLLCGIDWVTAQRERGNPARPLFEVANMSISFGLPGAKDGSCGADIHDAVHLAICRSVAKGTVYVVAAGNEYRNARWNRPAAYDEVITVSALADYDGRGGARSPNSDSCPYWTPERDDAFTRFSNFGADIDLIAPGRCVLSTYPSNRYAWMSGTSMAAPHVTGAVALYRSVYRSATPSQVRLALQAVGTRDWRTNTDPDGNPEKALWVGAFRTMPDFHLGVATAALRAAPGGETRVVVSVTRVGGFEDAVSLELANAPAGIRATSFSTTAPSATLIVRLDSSIHPGRYALIVRGTSGDVQRDVTVTAHVSGAPPRATFSSPRAGTSTNSNGSAVVSWSETSGGATIVTRTLQAQAGAIRTPGTCSDVRFSPGTARARTSPVTERVWGGYCYRWALTLSDSAGYRSTKYSGSVLVDLTAPRAPSANLTTAASASVDLPELGVDAAHVGHSGVVWVRGGHDGSVDLEITGFDPESGIAANSATVHGAGWRAAWVGNSADGHLRVTFTAAATEGALALTSTNGAGLTGPQTNRTLRADATPPTSAHWVSAPTDTTMTTTGPGFRLAWAGGSDTGSGLADSHRVQRYRTTASRGTCRQSGWLADGSQQLRADGSRDVDLQRGYCYAWSLRTLDNVGNSSAISWSGFVIVGG